MPINDKKTVDVVAQRHPTLDYLPNQRVCPFDPPPEYYFIRHEKPVAKVKTPAGDSAWLVSRHEDVKAALMDKRLSSNPNALGFPTYLSGEASPLPGFFLHSDAPDHTRLRKLVTKEFLSSHVEQLKPRMHEIIKQQIAYWLSLEGVVDFVEVFAAPVSAKIICELLGVPLTEHAFVRQQTDIVLDRNSSPDMAIQASMAITGCFDRIITDKGKVVSHDLLGRLIQNSKEEKQVSHDEVVGLATTLLLGAYDTMTLSMGLGVLILLKHRQQLDHFLADDTLGDKLVDELVRYSTINHAGLPRAAVEDLMIGGQKVKAGEGVLIMLNSANRDDQFFKDPDNFNIHRREKSHMGFGHGLHKCLGIHFSRAELSIAFREIFSRIPTLAIAVPEEELRFREEMVLYGVNTLPVTW